MPFNSQAKSLKTRRPAALLALLCGLLSLGTAHGAVIYSGLVGISVTADFEGVYVDLASGTPTNPSGDPDGVLTDSYTVGYSEPADWDINIFFGGIGIAHSDTFAPFVDGTAGDPDAITAGSQLLNVAFGTDIQAALSGSTRTLDSTFGGSGRPEGGSGESHFDIPDLDGATYSAFTPGDEGYIAFVIDTTGGDQYGWMRVTLNDDGSVGTIHDWAYSPDPGFTVGQIPEPSTLVLLLLASLGLLRRKRN